MALGKIVLGSEQEFAALAAESPIWQAELQNLHRHRGTGLLLAQCSSAFDILAERGTRPWGWVLAARQHQGRGQYGRVWQSPVGNLYASLALPVLPQQNHTLLPMLLAGSVVRTLRESGYLVSLKWPNDIVSFDNKSGLQGKVGGLLLEQRQGRPALGLGLNFVALPALPALPGLPVLPASHLEMPQEGLVGFWCCCVTKLEEAWKRWEGDQGDLRSEVEEVLAFRQQEVELFDYDAAGKLCVCRGILLGIGQGGGLLLDNSGGGVEHKMRGSLRPVIS